SDTAIGYSALGANTEGAENTANGVAALQDNTSGNDNTATGFEALLTNTTGNNNTANGSRALFLNSTGANNVALGYEAGFDVFTASNLICIGANVFGANMSNTTWIGNVFGTTTISGTTAPVVVSDSGQLGMLASSKRFKKDIATMEKTSEAILSLRPV